MNYNTKAGLILICSYIISLILIYLSFCFVTLDLDFRNWNQVIRAVYVMLAPSISLIPTVIVYEWNR
jgi:hypothetical protein